jgi:hypothetical protein
MKVLVTMMMWIKFFKCYTITFTTVLYNIYYTYHALELLQMVFRACECLTSYIPHILGDSVTDLSEDSKTFSSTYN